jgi:hypothetical protein
VKKSCADRINAIKHYLRPPLFLAGALCLLNSGCATMLSGSSEKVSIQATPPEATLMVLGGPAGSLLVKSKKYGALTRKVLDLAATPLGQEDQQIIDKIGIEYFLTSLIVEYKLGLVPADTSEALAKFYKGVPAPFKKKLLEKINIEGFGPGPLAPVLKRGRVYAVVGYQPGMLIQIEAIETKFNWVTLLNIFTLGLGVPVDVYTGAWLKLDPNKLNIAVNRPVPAAQ